MARTASSPPNARLRSEDRRAALVHVAATLLAEGGIDAVSMDAVAARAEVSRPLVYKHFANRHEVLAEVYRQEATALDAAIAAAVGKAEGFEAKLRALVRAALQAETTHGPIFTPLLRAGVRDSTFRREQHDRDRRTARYFTKLAVAELDLDEASAAAAISSVLAGIEPIRAQWRARPTADRRAFLEDLYIDLVMGGLRTLAGGPDPARSSARRDRGP